MKTLLTAPSKTFIIGEYLATQGGTAMIAATLPRFELHVETRNDSKAQGIWKGIAATSPAGRLLERHAEELGQFDITFSDPHNGQGGLGASSAQYALLLYMWLMFCKNKKGKDIPRLAFAYLEEYLVDAWSGEGMRPSGADMLAQISGGIAIVSTSTQTIYSLEWPFSNLDFTLFRTGRKIATHEHLKTVGIIPKGILQEIADVTVKGLQEKSESLFLAGVKSYGETLAQFGLLSAQSANTIKTIYTWPEVLATKGCGAMGDDIILIVHRSNVSEALKVKASSLGLTPIADAKSLSLGIVSRDFTETGIENEDKQEKEVRV